MADISGFPYFEVQFTKQGDLFEPAEKQAVLGRRAGSFDELFVVAHGWNNDMAEARALYQHLFANVRRALDDGRAPGLAGRRIGVLGVLWPSKKFAEEELIPGGGASLGGEVEDQALAEQIDALKGTFDGPTRRRSSRPKRWCRGSRTIRGARQEFVDLCARSCPSPRTRPTTHRTRSSSCPARQIFDLLEAPILPGPPAGGGGGGAAAIGLAEAGPPPGMDLGARRRRHRRLLRRHQGSRAAASSTSRPTTR